MVSIAVTDVTCKGNVLGAWLLLMTDLGQVRLPCNTAHSITG
jgi:hypothetical protein